MLCKRIELKRCIITESRWKRNWHSLISPEAIPILLPSYDKISTIIIIIIIIKKVLIKSGA